ncbi:DNA cytosine methyltransferase [Streptomyces sp. SID7834]|nr:DNA cytosine methyltransferase [Streptomyces sp. SID7834]MYT57685.1 DNA cytosine methyltransferase [Streptomyces sp. SID7834]
MSRSSAAAQPRLGLDDVLAATARPVAPVPGQRELGDVLVDGPRIGSFCTGYGGLDNAVQRVLGGDLAWVADNDSGASRILTHHYPDVPNLGDITVADWQYVLELFGRLDMAIGGYPCQPFSGAGLQKGIADVRHIWPFIARALGVLRPRIAFFENVRGHLRRGFDVVLADLAELGFDAEWCTLFASEIGAPHPRERLFILAVAQDADCESWVERWLAASRQTEGRRARPDACGRDRVAAADADSLAARRREVAGSLAGATGTDAEEARGRRGNAAAVHSGGELVWGKYAPAVARWEAIRGVRAPRAVNDRGLLSPEFEEWMLGLDPGHVTGVPGLGRNAQLKALGNGVVPQQAEAALRMLLARRFGLTA